MDCLLLGTVPGVRRHSDEPSVAHTAAVWAMVSAAVDCPVYAQVVIDEHGVLHLDAAHKPHQSTVKLSLDDVGDHRGGHCVSCLSRFTPSLQWPPPVSTSWLSWAMPLSDAVVHGIYEMPPYLMETAIWHSILHTPDQSGPTMRLLDRAMDAVPRYPDAVPLQLVAFKAAPVTDLWGDWCAQTGSRRGRHATDPMIAQAHVIRGAASGFIVDLQPGATGPCRMFAAALPDPCLPWLEPAGFSDITVFGYVQSLTAARLLAEQAVNREDGGQWLLAAATHMD